MQYKRCKYHGGTGEYLTNQALNVKHGGRTKPRRSIASTMYRIRIELKTIARIVEAIEQQATTTTSSGRPRNNKAATLKPTPISM